MNNSRPNPTLTPSSGTAMDAAPSLSAATLALVLFLRRNMLRVFMVAAPLATLAFAASWFYFDKYWATAVVMVDPHSTKPPQQTPALAPDFGPDTNVIDSIVQIAKSDAFLGALVDRLDLTHDPYFAGRGATDAVLRASTIEKLKSNFYVSRLGATYVIDVSVSSPSPDSSAHIANAGAQKIIDDQRNLRASTTSAAAQAIQARLGELRERVNHAESREADLKTKLQVTDVGQGSTLLERRVYELNQQQVLAAAKAADAKARVEQLRRAASGLGDNLPPSVQSTLLASLRSEYARLTRQSADQGTLLGDRHPEVKSLRAQIADVRRQIANEIGRLMAAARAEYSQAEQSEAALSRQIKDAQRESGELDEQLVKLAELEREAKAERAVYEQFLTRARELEESKNAELANIHVVSAAEPPVTTAPKKWLLAVASAAAGLLAGLLYALVAEARRPTLKTADQAERRAGIETAAMAPLFAAAPGRPQGASRPDLSPWLGDLCARLALDARGAESRVILVASALPGEGRTTVASAIAAHFGRSGAKVLMIQGSRAKSRGGKERFGLLDLLEKGEGLRQAFVKSAQGVYQILPFGGGDAPLSDAETSALMSGPILAGVFKLCRRWFDVIIIDGPAACEASYARLLACQADTLAFVVEWDRATAAEVNEALDRLDVEDAALVFNRVDVARLRLFDPARARRLQPPVEEFSRAA